MARHRSNLGARKSVRIDLQTQGFLIRAPDAPWIECTIVDVGDRGVCLEVEALAVPNCSGWRSPPAARCCGCACWCGGEAN
jgi:hypothetical protein